MKRLLKFTRCFTGRRWIEIGPLGIGFGPLRLIERVYWGKRLVYAATRRRKDGTL